SGTSRRSRRSWCSPIWRPSAGRRRRRKRRRGGDRQAKALLAVAEKLEKHLDSGKRALTLVLDPEEKEIARRLFLLTSRPMIFAANVGEDDLASAAELPRVAAVRHYAETHGGPAAVVVSAEIEAQLAELPGDDAVDYLAGLGVA